MKNNFYARKTRQLSYRIKLLKNYSTIKSQSSSKFNKLVSEINFLVQELKYCISKRKIRKIIGGAAVLLGIGLGPTAQAQQFGPRILDPFGLSQSTEISMPLLCDLDGDGDLDVLAINYDGNFEFFENIGDVQTPNFSTPSVNPFNLTGADEMEFPTIGDIDNDGDLDVLTFSYDDQILFFENVGDVNTPMFTAPITNAFGIQTSEIFLSDLVDIDNDGDLDLISTMEYGQFAIYINNGTPENPQFQPPMSNPWGLGPTIQYSYFPIPALSDIDSDGDLDILKSEYYGVFSFHENIGTATEPSFVNNAGNQFGIQTIQYDVNFLTFGDLDGDGDEDLLTASYQGRMAYYELLGVPDTTQVATEEFINVNSVAIFPNPTSDILTIQSNIEFQSFEVFDIVGRIILSENFNGQTIDVQSLNTGIYVLKLKNEKNEIVVKRFEKI